MEAEDDHRLPNGSKHDAAERAADDRQAVEGVKQQAHEVRDQGGNRANNQIGSGDHHNEHACRHKEELYILREMLAAPLLQLCREPNRDDNRNDRARITRRRHDDGYAEESRVVVHGKGSAGKNRSQNIARCDVDHRRIRKCDTERHANELTAAKLLCRGIAKDDRQEVEEAVTSRI